MPLTLKLLILPCLALLEAGAQGATPEEARLKNWPQWRGPLATGLAPQASPPLSWNENKNVRWKTKLPGFGTSTPIIWDNQVFILTAIKTGGDNAAAPSAGSAPPERGPDGPRGRGGFGGGPAPVTPYQFVVLSLDRQSGQILWQQTAREQVPHEGHHRDHGFASASPITDGTHLLAYFGSRGLYCYDMQGQLRWSKDFGDMQTRAGFGEGSSPALHGDVVVVNWDHEGEDFIVALDKNTGDELWRQPRDEKTGWSTPLVLDHEGQVQVVVNASGAVRSYELKSGQLLWECGGQTDNAIPSPVAGHGLVYAMSGFRGSALKAIRLGHTGNLTDTANVAWDHDRDTPYVPSPLLYGQLLYFHKGNNAQLSCVNALNGQAYFSSERLDGPSGIYASPVGAAGRVYIAGRDGTSLVLKNSGKLEVLAVNKLEDRFDASPAMAGTDLFLRGHEHLYCLSE